MARQVGVVGAGGWGTALAKVLAEKGEEVTLWCHGASSCRDITDRRENRAYLAGVHLPENIAVTSSLTSAVAGKFLVICAVPSHAVAPFEYKSLDKKELPASTVIEDSRRPRPRVGRLPNTGGAGLYLPPKR